MRVDVEMVPEGREDCRECFGAGFVIDDPGGPLKDMPPMLPARGCPKCNPTWGGQSKRKERHDVRDHRP